jgi:hypothetical protein
MLAAAPALAQPAAPAQPSPLPPPPMVSLDAAAPSELTGRRVRLYLADGQELNATLLGENKDKYRVRIGSGAPFDIARAHVRAVEDADAPRSPENFFRDPNLHRTFYAPTGFRLRAGEGYFSQKELVLSAFGFGVNDNVSVLVGTMAPLWFSPGLQNVLVGVLVGTDVGNVWHLAAGVQGFGMPGQTVFGASSPVPQGLGFAYGTATCGTPTLNATFSLGGAIHNLNGTRTGAGALTIMVSAYWRVHPYVALETENWFFPGIPSGVFSVEPFMILNSFGLRVMNQNLAADLGVVRLPGTLTPIPWVDFTYAFGA